MSLLDHTHLQMGGFGHAPDSFHLRTGPMQVQLHTQLNSCSLGTELPVKSNKLVLLLFFNFL